MARFILIIMNERVKDILNKEISNKFSAHRFESIGHSKDMYKVSTSKNKFLLYLYPKDSNKRVQTEVSAFK